MPVNSRPAREARLLLGNLRQASQTALTRLPLCRSFSWGVCAQPASSTNADKEITIAKRRRHPGICLVPPTFQLGRFLKVSCIANWVPMLRSGGGLTRILDVAFSSIAVQPDPPGQSRYIPIAWRRGLQANGVCSNCSNNSRRTRKSRDFSTR